MQPTLVDYFSLSSFWIKKAPSRTMVAANQKATKVSKPKPPVVSKTKPSPKKDQGAPDPPPGPPAKRVRAAAAALTIRQPEQLLASPCSSSSPPPTSEQVDKIPQLSEAMAKPSLPPMTPDRQKAPATEDESSPPPVRKQNEDVRVPLLSSARLTVEAAKGQGSALSDIADNILTKLMGEFEWMEASSLPPPRAHGGIPAFSSEAYMLYMERDKFFSCLVPFHYIGFAA